MKYANNIGLRVFAFPHEDSQILFETLLDLAGFETKEQAEDENVRVTNNSAKGFSEKRIEIFEVYLDKDRHCNTFLKRLSDNLSDAEKKRLIKEENRMDEHLDFFLRLDKKALIDGRFALTELGECFHVRINIAAFPRKKEVARKIIEDIFG